MRAAAQVAGIGVVPALVGFPATIGDYVAALKRAHEAGADLALVGDSPEGLQYGPAIAAAAADLRLPALYTFPESVAAGGLVSYAFDLKDLNRHAARDIDAILKGASPADLPFYQVTRLILSLNLRTARVLGLEVPPSLVLRADEVLE